MTLDLDHLTRVADLAGLDLEVTLPRHHHVVLNERRFHYLEWGEPGNPPLLFLHGGNQSARTWDLICLTLSTQYHCIALDQRGHGESEWSYEGHYAPQDHTKDIEALVDHLGWKKFSIIGMSMGGMNALWYATTESARLNALVSVDVGPFLQVEKSERLISFVEGNKKHKSLEDFVTAALKFNPRRKPELLRHSLTHTTRELADGSWEWKADRRKSLSLKQMSDWLSSLQANIAEIQCPVLVIRGAESALFSNEDAHRFVDLLPRGSFALVKKAGHTIQGDNPKGLLDALNNFFPQHLLN